MPRNYIKKLYISLNFLNLEDFFLFLRKKIFFGCNQLDLYLAKNISFNSTDEPPFCHRNSSPCTEPEPKFIVI
ncbi:MAG: hypothetical protein ACK55Z_15235, partial [bacterium]